MRQSSALYIIEALTINYLLTTIVMVKRLSQVFNTTNVTGSMAQTTENNFGVVGLMALIHAYTGDPNDP